VFGVLGVGLVGGGLAVPEFETLLFIWGGTALFVALLLQFVMGGSTLSAAVTSDIYTTMAGNARRASSVADRKQGTADGHRYVPDADGVTVVVDDREFDAVGQRLLATGDDLTLEGAVGDLLSVLFDVLINELELATRLTATTDEELVTVTVIGSRIESTELFDHPIASVIGVGLAQGLDTPVAVETAREDEQLVVTAEPTSSR
jgi:hypothetical protein